MRQIQRGRRGDHQGLSQGSRRPRGARDPTQERSPAHPGGRKRPQKTPGRFEHQTPDPDGIPGTSGIPGIPGALRGGAGEAERELLLPRAAPGGIPGGSGERGGRGPEAPPEAPGGGKAAPAGEENLREDGGAVPGGSGAGGIGPAESGEGRGREGDGGGGAPEAPGQHGKGAPEFAGADGSGRSRAGAAPEGGRGQSGPTGPLSPAGKGGGCAPGEDPSPGRHAQEPAAESPADDRAAPEFQDGDPGQGRGDPGAEGKGFLPGSGEPGDARPDRAPDRAASEPGRAQRPGALQVGIRQQQTPPGPEAAAPDPSGGNLNPRIWAQPDPSPLEWFDWNSLLDSQPFLREEVWDHPGRDPGADSGLESGIFPLCSVAEAIFQPDLSIPARPGWPMWLPEGFPNRIRHRFRISPFFGSFSKSKSEDSTLFPKKNSSFPQQRAGSRHLRPPAPSLDLENPHPAPKIPCFPSEFPAFPPNYTRHRRRVGIPRFWVSFPVFISINYRRLPARRGRAQAGIPGSAGPGLPNPTFDPGDTNRDPSGFPWNFLFPVFI